MQYPELLDFSKQKGFIMIDYTNKYFYSKFFRRVTLFYLARALRCKLTKELLFRLSASAIFATNWTIQFSADDFGESTRREIIPLSWILLKLEEGAINCCLICNPRKISHASEGVREADQACIKILAQIFGIFSFFGCCLLKKFGDNPS